MKSRIFLTLFSLFLATGPTSSLFAQDVPDMECELIQGRIVEVLAGSGGLELGRFLIESADGPQKSDFYISIHKYKTAVYEAGKYRSTWIDPRVLEVGDTVAAWYLSPSSEDFSRYPIDIPQLYQAVLVGVGSSNNPDLAKQLDRLPADPPNRPHDFGFVQFTIDETVQSVYPTEAPFERSYLESSDMVIVEILVGEDGAVQDAAAVKGTEAGIDYVLNYLKGARFKQPVRAPGRQSVGVVRVKLDRQGTSSDDRLTL